MNNEEQYRKVMREWMKFCDSNENCYKCKYKNHRKCDIAFILDNYYLVNKGNGVLK